MIRLDVLDGGHRRTVAIDANAARIGRDLTCDIVLPGDGTVSRIHAIVSAADGQLSLADAGSRNGTMLNGRPLTGVEPLHAGDRIMLGSFVVVVPADLDEVVETLAADPKTATRLRVETGLSTREIEVLRLVGFGLSDQQIADTLVISLKTVHSHLDRIRTKTDCRRRPELIRFALDHGVA
jgi:DNA-binding CsgD family transcriptional regulator